MLASESKVWYNRNMTNEQKIQNAATMFGTGSKQHLAAIKRFGSK